MSPTSFPAYLTSNASSRTHHALLAKLNDARTDEDEEEIISAAVDSSKAVFSSTQNTDLIENSLDDSLEFALMPALQLAGGGKTLRERRIGYLYLTEMLPVNHELHMMLINTIRKDLDSSIPQQILLALHSIIKLPSKDLASAVTSMLITKAFLRHKLPAIRQRTLQALMTLCPTSAFPLSMSRICKLLTSEREPSVLAVLYKLVEKLIKDGRHQIQSEIEREYIVERLVESAEEVEEHGNEMAISLVKACNALLVGSGNKSAISRATQYLQNQFQEHTANSRPTYLLELCHFASISPVIGPRLLDQVTSLLSNPSTSTSASTSAEMNEHILALRCLTILPKYLWDGKLGEQEMEMIMEGLNSQDSVLRITTLRLFRRHSPELLKIAYQTQLTSLKTLKDLSLPPNKDLAGLTLEEKVSIGKEETAKRGLEVLAVQYGGVGDGPLGMDDNSENEEEGSKFGEGVGDIWEALNDENDNNMSEEWGEGLEIVRTVLNRAGDAFRRGFLGAIPPDHILGAIR